MKTLAKAGAVVLLGGSVVVGAAWAAWWYVRWKTAMGVFALVHDQLRDSLGLSELTTAVIAAGASIIAALVVTVLVLKARHLLAAGILVVLFGAPLALWVNARAAHQCFNWQTDRPLCSLWESPDGNRHVLRMDGDQPPSSWTRIHDATHGDVRAYLPNKGSPTVQPRDRVPRPVTLESCTPPPVFFDASAQAVVFWSRSGDELELWDRRGPHPTTGIALSPMTSEIASEVCRKLAAAKTKHDAELGKERAAAEQQAREQTAQIAAEHQCLLLDQERSATAAQQTQEQAAYQAAQQTQRQRQVEADAQRKLHQVQSDENSRAAVAELNKWDRPSGSSGGVSLATLTLRNNDCATVEVYLDRRKLATVTPFASVPLSIYPGGHLLRACHATGCSPEFAVNAGSSPIAFEVSPQSGCGSPSVGYLVPARSIYRMVGRPIFHFPFQLRRR